MFAENNYLKRLHINCLRILACHMYSFASTILVSKGEVMNKKTLYTLVLDYSFLLLSLFIVPVSLIASKVLLFVSLVISWITLFKNKRNLKIKYLALNISFFGALNISNPSNQNNFFSNLIPLLLLFSFTSIVASLFYIYEKDDTNYHEK